MFNVLITLVAITQCLLALLVYLQKRHSVTHRIFSLLLLANLGWAVVNYISSLQAAGGTLETIRIVMTFVVTENTLLYLFARDYPSRTSMVKVKTLWWLLPFSAITAAATLSPYLFTSVSIVHGHAQPNPGPLMILFIMHMTYTLGYALASLIQKLRHSSGKSRTQLQLILFAVIVNWPVVALTNFGLVLVVRTTFFIKYSPLYGLAFDSIIAYAIMAQKLFDIRLAITRFVTYLLLLLTIAVTYGLIFMGLSNLIIHDSTSESTKQALSILIILPLVLGFQPLKAFFDRVTNRLFYRHGYEAQAVLDAIGDLITHSIDLRHISEDTARILTEALKSSFVRFVIIREDQSHLLLPASPTAADLDHLAAALRSTREDVTVSEDLDTTKDAALIAALAAAHVAAAVRLQTNDHTMGYLFVGEKRGGDSITTQDTRLLSILASELAAAIQNALSVEKIQRFNQTLQQKVDEATVKLKQENELIEHTVEVRTQELRTAQAKLQTMDDMKTEFISLTSHNLRTPLTIIGGNLELLGSTAGLPEAQARAVQGIQEGTKQLGQFVHELLDINSLQAGKALAVESISLADLLAPLLAEAKTQAEAKGLDFLATDTASELMVQVNIILFREALRKLLENAVKFTKAGSVTVTAVHSTDHCKITITDTGIGIPEAEQAKLFTTFHRATDTLTYDYEGKGIGLYFAKLVIEEHGGSIHLYSKPGEGVRVEVTAPVGAREVAPLSAS